MNTKKIITSIALATSMLATSMSAFAYSDTEGHWAKSAIDSLSGSKYISGYTDGTFKPDNYITRAEFAKILTNIFGVIDKSGVTLTDVSDGAWYADTMKIAVKAGYITGYSDGTVKPEANITRQEAAVMVYRAWALSPEGSVDFTDKGEVADWAENQIATLVAKKVLGGYADGSFKPNNFITRAEVAKVISNAISLGINKVATPNAQGTTSGILHVGMSSNRGNGGGGGGNGGNNNTTGDLPQTTPTPTPTPTPVTPPTVNEGNLSTVVDTAAVAAVAAAIDTALDAAIADTTNGVDADTPLDVELSLGNAAIEDKVMVVDSNGEMTFAEFKETLKGKTKAQIAAALAGVKLKVSDKAAADIGDEPLQITAEIKKAGTEDKVVDNAIVTEVSVNYLVESLKKYQSGTADASDMAIVAKQLTKGYTANKAAADKWLEDYARQYKLYNALMLDVAGSITTEITADNAATYAGYFTVMQDVLDKSVQFVVDKKGALTGKEALNFYADEIEELINTRVTDTADAAIIKTHGYNFGMNLNANLDAVNAAAAANSTDNKALVWDVYNSIAK